MKKTLVVGLMILGAVGLARADDDRPGSDWLSIEAVTQKLHEMGFTRINKIEADDGLWEAKGYRNGVYTKVKLDPRDGHVVRVHPSRKHDDED